MLNNTLPNSNRNRIRIATRKSALALAQTEILKQKLQGLYPDLQIEILGISTMGDKTLDTPLYKTGGKGLFVKELEESLLNHQADIALHSMKDVPSEMPESLEISAILEREDERDAFVSLKYAHFLEVPSWTRIGTSSLRRKAQLAAIRQDLHYQDCRGNVDTRLRKMQTGEEYEALILAVAGLKRLNLSDKIRHIFDRDDMVPCVGQGALGVQSRKEDSQIKEMLAALHHIPSACCVLAERSMNQVLGGSCQLPVGGLAILSLIDTHVEELKLTGMVALPDGSRVIKASMQSKMLDLNLRSQIWEMQSKTLGIQVAEQLLSKGARKIIQACLK